MAVFGRSVALSLVVSCAAAWCAQQTGSWRSRLYPKDWTPAFTDAEGRFLHDFSYAGYKCAAAALPRASAADKLFDAAARFGADTSGKTDSTRAIQKAIDAAEAAGGGVVWLPAGLYRCDGVLAVDRPGVVIRGEGPAKTRLYFTRTKKMSRRAHITLRGRVKTGPDLPLAADGANRACVVRVRDASGLKPGMDVSVGWVITDAFVAEHHMAGTWKVFNGKWRPFFRRTVAAIDTTKTPHEVRLDVPLRYTAKRRDRASLRVESGYLSECGIENLAISNAVEWSAAWGEHGVHAIDVRGAKDCWVRGVESFASPLPEAKGRHLQSGGVKVLDSKRITVADSRMALAQNRGGGGDGYLFEVSRSSEVLFRDCTATAGRHNFIQNWDFGSSGIVWLRCHSKGSRSFKARFDPIGWPAFCDYHHSLAMACLVDQCTLADGWYAGNRKAWSSGAGLTSTQCVFWNTRGRGVIRSWQFGWGYVIGTRSMKVETRLNQWSAAGSAPQDYVEGKGRGGELAPPSLYEDQLRRRLP